jgi:hypothetical protein
MNIYKVVCLFYDTVSIDGTNLATVEELFYGAKLRLRRSRMLKEMFIAYSSHYSIYLEKLRKTMKTSIRAANP